ncbi:MAG: hypothetical protein KDB95_00750 [Flavobacteriales bacterium]|nr:hypothetical protein [Flavobacteriales bacterium]
MFPLINVLYHGEQTIDYWEYLLALVYIAILYIFFARQKALRLKQGPEYRYYISALLAKIGASMFFSIVYFYIYGGGDSGAYFFSGLSMRNLALEDPFEYVRQMVSGDNSMKAWSRYSLSTAKPYQFMFFDDRTFFVLRVTSVVTFFTFKSFLLTNVLMATLSFFGIWACYRTFVGYFPQISGQLATGFLFMPSSIFWGSPVLKDTITFSAVCWWVHAVDEVFFKKRAIMKNAVVMALSAAAMMMVKPYIFMVLISATLLWLFYFRLVRVRNLLFKFVLFPITIAIFVGVTLFVLNKLGESAGHFALDGALKSIEATQQDLIRVDSYGSNSFDVGEFDGTWLGLVSKFPIAVNAAIFRPYLWECNNFTMILSGLENLWVLMFAVFAVLRAGPRFIIQCMAGVPIITMSLTFALLFGFAVGVSTPNFGALVRFKIPMVPFFICSMYIIVFLSQIKRAMKKNKLRFELTDFMMGTAHMKGIPELISAKRKARARKWNASDRPK